MVRKLIFENEVLTAYTHHLAAPEHVHVNCEFVLVTNGTALNTVDGISETIVNGDVFFLNHLPLHSITELSDDHEHIDLYITCEQLKQVCLKLFNEELYDFLMKDASEKKCSLNYDEFTVIVKKVRNWKLIMCLPKMRPCGKPTGNAYSPSSLKYWALFLIICIPGRLTALPGLNPFCRISSGLKSFPCRWTKLLICLFIRTPFLARPSKNAFSEALNPISMSCALTMQRTFWPRRSYPYWTSHCPSAITVLRILYTNSSSFQASPPCSSVI